MKLVIGQKGDLFPTYFKNPFQTSIKAFILYFFCKFGGNSMDYSFFQGYIHTDKHTYSHRACRKFSKIHSFAQVTQNGYLQ